MMQVDLARKPQEFVRLAAEAGCTQVFMGMESVNPQNLKAAEGKKQNKVEEYRTSSRNGMTAGVLVHAAYIIGLPLDSKEQVAEDMRIPQGRDAARSGLVLHADAAARDPTIIVK